MVSRFSLLWRYASHRGRLLGKDVDTHGVNWISRQYAFGPLVYVISIVLALLYPLVSVAFNFLLGIFFALPDVPLRRRNKSGPLAEKDVLSK